MHQGLGLGTVGQHPGPVVETSSTRWIHASEVCSRCENTEVSQSIQAHEELQKPRDGEKVEFCRNLFISICGYFSVV